MSDQAAFAAIGWGIFILGICGFLSAAIAEDRGLTRAAGFTIGILLGPIGISLVLLRPVSEKEQRRPLELGADAVHEARRAAVMREIGILLEGNEAEAAHIKAEAARIVLEVEERERREREAASQRERELLVVTEKRRRDEDEAFRKWREAKGDGG